jgi:HEAT repeat protein
LIELLGQNDHLLRVRAAWALTVIGQPSLQPLLKLADGSDARLRVEAIRILGAIGQGRAVNPLTYALTDPDPRVAQRAANALGRVGDPRSFHALLTALRHPSPDVRHAVCGALGELHIADAIGPLNDLAKEDTSSTTWGASVAEAALRAIATISAARPTNATDGFDQVDALLKRYQQ